MIIAFHGYAGSGKDEAAKVLVNAFGFQRIAFADPMREMLYALNPIVGYGSMSGTMFDVKDLIDKHGWDKAKRDYPEIREQLQRLGTEAGRQILGENIWVDTAMRKASQFENVVITDCRFENEAKAIRKANGIIVKIVRPGVAPVNNHISDKGLADYWIEETIHNNGTIEELHEKVRKLIQ